MKAAVYQQYGPPEVLQIQEVPKPVPQPHEVLIKIHATAVSSADWRLRKPDPWAVRLFFGLTRPRKKILGGTFSGEIEATGQAVTSFKKGEAIFASAELNLGAYAEYICLAETGVMALKPQNMSYAEASAIPFGGMTALHFLRKAKIQAGQKVLIYGASGAVGVAAVQLAKSFGAEVTGVCSTHNLALVRSLGADQVIDYTQEDFSQTGLLFDVVFDTVGKMSISTGQRSLKSQGTLILGASGFVQMFHGGWIALTSRHRVLTGVIREKKEDLVFFKELIEAGKLRAVIDKSYPLEKIVEAHRYVEQGHKKGNVILLLAER